MAIPKVSVSKSWFSIGKFRTATTSHRPAGEAPGEVWFIDCFHETIGEPGFNTIIALNFSEFLERALASNGCHYWLGEHPSYGDAFDRPVPGSAVARSGHFPSARTVSAFCDALSTSLPALSSSSSAAAVWLSERSRATLQQNAPSPACHLAAPPGERSTSTRTLHGRPPGHPDQEGL